MPARNRVTPRSSIEAIPLRGLFMGNRGRLHRDGEVVRHHDGRRWITCELSFRGRRVEQWVGGRYTVLFFHDEAVALAAGHRPCAECRWAGYDEYRRRWAGAQREPVPTADAMDRRLHAERLDGRRQRTSRAPWASLPDGAFALSGDDPVLVWGGELVPWSAAGYGTPVARPSAGHADVLTPPATLAVLRAGYVPVVADRPDVTS